MESFDIFDMMEIGNNLQTAVYDGDIGLVRNLLDSRDDHNLNARDKQGRTLLHYTACRGQYEIVQMLLEKGANPNLKDKNGNTPLHWCGHADVVELLILNGAHVEDRNCVEATPKDMAVRRGVSKDIIRTFEQYEKKQNKHLGEFKTLFHEFSDEMGPKNLIFLLLLLLFISLYAAYTITGLSSHLKRSPSIML